MEVSFYLYCEQESFNTIAQVVAYIGNEEPIDERSFDRIGVANPKAGWNHFLLEGSIFTEQKGA